MSQDSPSVAHLQAAADWRARLYGGNASEQDWVSFTEWLEQSPDHATAYDAITDTEADFAEAVEQLDLVDDETVDVEAADVEAAEEAKAAHSGPSWRPWAIAASLALAVVTSTWFGAGLFAPSGNVTTFATGPAEQREFMLANGLEARLNGESTLRQIGDGADVFALDAGEALFTVGPEHSGGLRVTVGDLAIVDRGTIFNVSTDDAAHRIAVSEGAVDISHGDQTFALTAGEMGVFDIAAGQFTQSSFDPATIGSWAEQRLEYASAGVEQVLSDAGRILGVSIDAGTCAPAAGFAGSIQLTGDTEADIALIADLLGCTAQSTQGGWIFAG